MFIGGYGVYNVEQNSGKLVQNVSEREETSKNWHCDNRDHTFQICYANVNVFEVPIFGVTFHEGSACWEWKGIGVLMLCL